MFDIQTISIVTFAGIFALLAIGMPLAFGSAILAVLVLIMKFGPEPLFAHFGSGPLNILAQRISGMATDYVLVSIPLFIFMANLLERSGIAAEMYDAMNIWLGRTRGGIAVVTAIMAVLMAAMSGIIGGEVVLLGLIALPQMLRLGYDKRLAIGTICAAGSLGTMIPPSIVLIMYGMVTETSISALFTAAFLPGFMLASFYIVYIIVRTGMHPEQAPLAPPRPDEPQGWAKAALFLTFSTLLAAGVTVLLLAYGLLDRAFAAAGAATALPAAPALWLMAELIVLALLGRDRIRLGWRMGKGLVAPLALIGVVLGSIYGGVTGITEAAAMGVLTVAIFSLIRGELNFSMLFETLLRSLKATGNIMWVTIGATALAGAYTIAGGPGYIAGLVGDSAMPPMLIILMMMLVCLLLGAVMDWVGIVLLIMPVFLPIVRALPVESIGIVGTLDPAHVSVWFGVLFCMNMQVSFLSPPFGPAAFYLKSVAPAHISLTDIFRSFLPFIVLQLAALVVLMLWPPIATLLL